uniref:DSBA-like thioredoxin domain-containing protein n=1 Tax=Pyrodinium bahamense TaxID=73915 RepID=A0A7R9ZV89_9DINO|mmetsp:Transcript_11379/g.31058  ORF Transcript_11379/g.31058 Transcript_11379/m.31058 type:complete len:157 (+) Transcript_11379:438-908(+)
MRQLGRRAGIELDYGVQTNWQPVDSQRLMLWARQFGKQERYMSALAHLHFEHRESASHKATLLKAAEACGLDAAAAEDFLKSDELRDAVWRSYGDTIHEKGIHAIPYFVFNSPLTDGGPFRSGTGRPVIVNGSGDQQMFLEIFERLLRDVDKKGCL